MACRFKESIRAYGSRDELHIIMKFEYQIGFVNVPLAFKLQCTVCIKLMLAFYFLLWNAFHEPNYLIFSSLTMCKKIFAYSICNQKVFNCLHRYPQAQIQSMSWYNLMRRTSCRIGRQSHEALLFLSLWNLYKLIIAL